MRSAPRFRATLAFVPKDADANWRLGCDVDERTPPALAPLVAGNTCSTTQPRCLLSSATAGDRSLGEPTLLPRRSPIMSMLSLDLSGSVVRAQRKIKNQGEQAKKVSAEHSKDPRTLASCVSRTPPFSSLFLLYIRACDFFYPPLVDVLMPRVTPDTSCSPDRACCRDDLLPLVRQQIKLSIIRDHQR